MGLSCRFHSISLIPLLACQLALYQTARAQTFSNPAPITIIDLHAASPYPSTITVSGVTGPVQEVVVSLNGFSHTFPNDIAVLLVSPDGNSVLLMGQVGGGCDALNTNLRFADGAGALTSCINSGTYRPTQLTSPTFAAPAPTGPYGAALSNFSGGTANGNWKLFVQDFVGGDSGSISGGWTLSFMSSNITYQGRLDNSDVPVNGTADFQFALFSTPTGGISLASREVDNLSVTNGVFSADLLFTPDILNGQPRWLQISARNPAGSGQFQAMSTRQPLSCSPYSIHSRSALVAENAVTAQQASFAQLAATASLADSATSADFADLAFAALRLNAPSGGPTDVVHVTSAGAVGVGTTSPSNLLSVNGAADISGLMGVGTTTPQARLHVTNGLSGATPQAAAELLVEDNASCYVNMLSTDAGEHGVSFGSPASSIHGGIYYKNAVGMDFRTNDNLSRMTINSAGNVGIGVGVSGGSIDARLHVAGGSASGRPLKVDRTGSDGELIAFARDDGVFGNITIAGGVVSYNAFTGSHWAWMDHQVDRGTLISMTGENRTSPSGSEAVYGVAVTSRANDPACLGSYLAPADGIPQGHQIMAAGNGEMWVVNTGRDIEPGDYLISSDVSGCAMVDDAQRFAIGNIVARAAETVHWKDVKGQKARISVLFGNFTRSTLQEGRIHDLELQNAELLKRIERLERALNGGHKLQK